ncbi:unnamed protein product, partial [Urochloa humidicola]
LPSLSLLLGSAPRPPSPFPRAPLPKSLLLACFFRAIRLRPSLPPLPPPPPVHPLSAASRPPAFRRLPIPIPTQTLTLVRPPPPPPDAFLSRALLLVGATASRVGLASEGATPGRVAVGRGGQPPRTRWS